MAADLYLFSVISALVYLVVGIRLFALSRRTRERAEFLLALNYLCTGVSYILYEFPGLLGNDPTWDLIAARHHGADHLQRWNRAPLALHTRCL